MNNFDRRLSLARNDFRGIHDVVERKRAIAKSLFPDENIDISLSKMEYRIDNKRDLDLCNPKDISSKLHWLKINFRESHIGDYVDKYKAREIVKNKVGEKYLPKCYWVGDDLSKVNRNALPKKFVLKANHSWNKNIFCFNKDTFNWSESRNESSEWLQDDHYLMHGEWAYSQIKKPLLIIEELLEVDGDIPDDYKVYCFNGEPKLVKYDSGRNDIRVQMHLDINWNPLPFHNPNYAPVTSPVLKPKNFNEMLSIAKTLSEGFPFLRVDLYNIHGRVYFGEFTLYPCGGNLRFEPDEWNYLVGDLLDLGCFQ
ncbi:ATP-grasp fold amidoligase family protein [Erwinia rhapontici]|uniref:ATP-grasp fold amidoligase family protein n=1 Tax=Erwinia rhapontici TaxID=55212 RepID=UPI001331BEFF|nr:ATP-grasp fold amidoligase family protein [Erwinia rhapontici]MBP2156375.1 hypothetical protein [Erwinia rhapontici]